MNKFRHFIFSIIACLALLAPMGIAAELEPNTSYTVVLSRISETGEVIDISSELEASDADGILPLEFTQVPTCDGAGSNKANFLLITVKDNETTVRRSLVPAPQSGQSTEFGANTLSEVQTEAILQIFSDTETDNTIVASMAYIFFQSDKLGQEDISKMTNGLAEVMETENGFKDQLETAVQSESKIRDFVSAFTCNTDPGAKTLRDFSAHYRTANNQSTEENAAKSYSKAGTVMGEIFIDAAQFADIETEQILMAFEMTGDAAGNNANFSSLSTEGAMSMNQSVSGLMNKLKDITLDKKYRRYFNYLNADTSLVSNYLEANSAKEDAWRTFDEKYGFYKKDPAGYLASNENGHSSHFDVINAMQTESQQIYNDYRNNIAASNSQLETMRQAIATALNIDVSSLADLGRDQIYNSSTSTANIVNWPIPKVIAMTWVANSYSAGGDLSYTRIPGLTIPSNMSDWQSTKNEYNDVPDPFKQLLRLMDDLNIVQHKKWSLWDNAQVEPTAEQKKASRETFITDVKMAINGISGYSDHSTAITEHEQEALVGLLLRPETF